MLQGKKTERLYRQKFSCQVIFLIIDYVENFLSECRCKY